MKNRILSVVMASLCAASVWTQTQSPMKEATSGLFGNEADNVVSVTGFSGVAFDHFYTAASYGTLDASGKVQPGILNAAGMFHAGPVTLGISYVGALAGEPTGTSNHGQQTTFGSTETFTAGQSTAFSETSTVYQNHNAFVLVGLPKLTDSISLGIRPGFSMSGSNVTTATGTVEEIKNQNTLGFSPSLAAGAVIKTDSGFSFSPNLTFTFKIANSAGEAGGNVEAGSSITVEASDGTLVDKLKMYRSYRPMLDAGLSVGFPSNSPLLVWNAGASYGFSYLIMPEKYVREAEGTTISERTWKTDKAMSNAVSLNGQLSSTFNEKFSVKAKAQFDLSYNTAFIGGMTDNKGTVSATLQDMEHIDRKNLVTGLTLSAGANYAINDKVSFFAGFAFKPVEYSWTKEESYAETSPDTVNVKDDRVVKAPQFTHMGLGLQFTPIQNLSMSLAIVKRPSTLTDFAELNDLLNSAIRFGITFKN